MTFRASPPYGVRRRDLLRAGAGLLVAASAAGCSFFDTGAVRKDGSGQADNKTASKGKESPLLAAQVKAGKLPPVEERLPKNPMVVKPLRKIGTYGGVWNSAMVTEEDASWLTNSVGYDPLVRWTPKWTNSPGIDEIMPNVAAEFDELEGGRQFRFKLRDGLKWSDGKPCTAEDIAFGYQDVHVFEPMHQDGGFYELWLSNSGNPARFEQEDETTVRFFFEEPKPGFINELAVLTLIYPKHYLQQFHLKYNKNVEQEAKQAKLSDWIALWETKSKGDEWRNKDLPTLNAWRVTQPLGQGTAVIAERNPYYWKTDPEGSQLPYIDKIQCEVLLDSEVEVLKILNGELDMQMRNFATVRNKPVIARNREKGDYRMFTVGPPGVNSIVIGLNQTFPDPKKRALFANKDFRVGLSHAINRQKIIDTVYSGQGTPWQCAPLEDSPVYDEELGTQYIEYDAQLANDHLDRAGLTRRNSDGIRLDANGTPARVVVLVSSGMPDHVDALELIKADWKTVGVDAVISRLAETLYWERVEANNAEASTWTGGDFEVRATQGSNHYYLPSNPRGASRYGNRWALWYREEGGDEPPADIKKQLELFDQMRQTYNADQATELGKQILQITKDRFFYIGICTPPEEYGIAKNAFHNVPEEMPGSTGYMGPGPTNPEQYFITGE